MDKPKSLTINSPCEWPQQHWVAAINKQGGFASWCWDVSFDVNDILEKHS